MHKPDNREVLSIAVPASDKDGLVILGRLGIRTTPIKDAPCLLTADFPASFRLVPDSCPERIEGPGVTVVVHHDEQYIELRNTIN
jgi:hypothetical protein